MPIIFAEVDNGDSAPVGEIYEVPHSVKRVGDSLGIECKLHIDRRQLMRLVYGFNGLDRWRQKVKAKKAMLGYWQYKLYCAKVSELEWEAHHAEQ